MPTKNAFFLFSALAGMLLASAQALAVELITDFTFDYSAANGSLLTRTAAWDGEANVFSNTNTTPADYANNTKWTQAAASIPAPYTFTYNISSLGIGAAVELRITVDTVSSTSNLSPAAGNGIAVFGGANNAWWDPSDSVALGYTVVIRDAGNNDITGNFSIDLTGVAMRWELNAAARFAGQAVTSNVGSVGGAGLQGVSLTSGQSAETSFTFDQRTGNNIAQIQQLRFEIVGGPDTSAPAIASKSPADNATAVPVGSNLVATFNENIALTGTGTVTIRDLGPGPDLVINLPDSQVSVTGGRTLVINPSADLLPNNGYAVRISADAVRDQATPPNAFAGIPDDATWDFSTAGPPPVGPNVIVFLLDDLGLTDVQQHPTYFPDGSPLFETPNMHRLAGEGMRFNQAYAQPLCSASRACLLSGQDTAARERLYLAIVGSSVPNPTLPATSGASSPYNYPTDRNHMPLGIETIAERLKAAGYVTWHAGKWHLSPAVANTAFYPDKQGFDKQLGVGGSGPPSYFGPFAAIPNLVDYNGNPAPGAKGDHIADHMQKLVKATIDNHLATDPARPFFLYYPAYSVHAPHEAKRSLFNYYQAKLAGLPNSKHKHPVMAAQIDMADKELGSMLDYLDIKGLTNNTLFIFLSDNGGLSIEFESGSIFDDIGTDGIPDDQPNNVVNGSYAKTTAPVAATTQMTEMAPRRAGKGALFEGGIRVPMIVRYPDGGIPAGAGTNEAVHLTDIYQTILDYTPAVAKPGYRLDGASLKPVLEQTGSLPDRDIFIHFPRNNTTWGSRFLSRGYPDPGNYPFNVYPGGTAVINYPYKMIARYSTAHDAATVDYQLFRPDLDVGENTNVAGDFPEVVDAMRKRLAAYYSDTGALVPTRNPAYNGTSVNLPETTAQAYLGSAGLTPGTPQTFLLADPDLDERRNEDEFLQQTNPNATDGSRATVWLYDNGTFDELRFAIPANGNQASFQILDPTGAVAFTSASGLTLDAQYGPFYVYKPTNPQPGGVPGDYRISLNRPAPGPSVTPDTDGDLLPDAYESSNGLNSGDPSDGNADNDGDGFTRGQEYLAGTSDFDRSDRFQLRIAGQGSPGTSLGFTARNQKSYRLYKSGNLADWTLWEDFGVGTGDHEVTLPLKADRDREFYRLEAYQP